MQIKRLGDIIKISSGGTPLTSKREYYDSGTIPWAKTGDLKVRHLSKIPDCITQLGLENSSAKIFPKNTVLIAMYGATIGNCSILKTEAATNQACAALLPSKEVNEEFLFFFLSSIKRELINKGVGGGQPNISATILKEIKIPVPSLLDQIRIAAILTQAESLIIKRKESIALLDELLKSIFLEMFGDPITNEKGWNELELKKSTTKIGSGSTPRGGKEIYEEEGISLIRSLNVYDNEFKYNNLAFINYKQAEKLKNVELYSNDVLFNITGASICRCTVVPNNILPARVNQHVSILRPIPEILNSKFLSNLLISDNVKRKLLGIGSSGGAIMQAITKEQLQKFKIPIPPIELQNKFGTIVEKVEVLKKEYEASLRELQNMYEVLSQKAFKGGLNVSNANLELYKEVVKTPVAGSLEPSKEVEDPPVFPKNDIHIKDMSLDDYYNIPEDIIAKYGSIEDRHEDWEFMLKKNFHDSAIEFSKLEEIYNKITYDRGGYFVFEDWKTFIFNELSKSKSFLKQKYNTKTNQLELLINEIKKS